MVVGLLAAIPLFMGKSPLGNALSSLSPLGLLMLAAGAVMLWWGRGSVATEDGNDVRQRGWFNAALAAGKPSAQLAV